MLRFVSILLAVFLLSSTANAQETYTRYRLPDSVSTQLHGERHQAFNLGGYQELLRMDNDLRHLTYEHDLDVDRMAHLTEASVQYTLALDEANLALETSEADRLRLNALYEEENRRRHDAENQPDYSWIPWSLVGGLAVSTLILGLIVGVQ